MKKVDRANIAMTEDILRTLIYRVGLKNFLVAFHNINNFGDIWQATGLYDLLDEDDKNLKKWYKHVDALLEIVEKG